MRWEHLGEFGEGEKGTFEKGCWDGEGKGIVYAGSSVGSVGADVEDEGASVGKIGSEGGGWDGGEVLLG